MTAHRRRLRSLLACTLLLAMVVLGACDIDDDNDSRSATQGLPDLTQELEAQKWRLVWGDSSLGTRVVRRVTLQFEDGKTVFGQGPCNRYRGTFTTDLDDWTVTIRDLDATTDESCAPRAMRAEREYLHALRRVRDVEFSGDHFEVVLESSTGDRLSYEAYDTYR